MRGQSNCSTPRAVGIAVLTMSVAVCVIAVSELVGQDGNGDVQSEPSTMDVNVASAVSRSGRSVSSDSSRNPVTISQLKHSGEWKLAKLKESCTDTCSYQPSVAGVQPRKKATCNSTRFAEMMEQQNTWDKMKALVRELTGKECKPESNGYAPGQEYQDSYTLPVWWHWDNKCFFKEARTLSGVNDLRCVTASPWNQQRLCWCTFSFDEEFLRRPELSPFWNIASVKDLIGNSIPDLQR